MLEKKEKKKKESIENSPQDGAKSKSQEFQLARELTLPRLPSTGHTKVSNSSLPFQGSPT